MLITIFQEHTKLIMNISVLQTETVKY